MSRVVTRDTVPGERLEAILRPKDGVVLEREAASHIYEAAGGPFETYRRTVTVTPNDDGTAHVEQVVEFTLALLRFSWVVTPLFRAHLRKLEEPARPPWWAPIDRVDPPAARSLGSLGSVAVI